MRTLVVSHAKGVWGAERSMLELAPALATRGVELVLAAPTGGDFETAWRALGLEFAPLRILAHRGVRSSDGRRPNPLGLAREAGVVVHSAARVAWLARALGAELIHSNSLTGHLECALAGRLVRRATVLELHDLVAPGMGRKLLSAAVRLAESSVSISRAVAGCVNNAEEPFDARSRRIVLVPQAVDADRFCPGEPNALLRAELGAASDEPLVGILGRIDPEKQHEVVVRAVAALEGTLSRVRLVIVGASHGAPAGYEEQLRAEAGRLLGDRVRFVPPRADIPAVLRCLDVLVNASVAEPFGLTVLEAQACGTPVVATNAGGIPEFVDDGLTGLLVPPSDADALSAAIARLLTDITLQSSLKSNARRMVETDFRIERRADAIANVYREAARRRSGR